MARVDALGEAVAVRPGGGMSLWLIYGLIFVGMWFLLIAPNRKRQRAHQQMLARLRVGDKVLLSSGIFAKIVQMKGAHLLVEVARGVRMDVLLSHVQQLLEQDGGELADEEPADAVEEPAPAAKAAPTRGRPRKSAKK
jgi:preprotein translocase subunit YajC